MCKPDRNLCHPSVARLRRYRQDRFRRNLQLLNLPQNIRQEWNRKYVLRCRWPAQRQRPMAFRDEGLKKNNEYLQR